VQTFSHEHRLPVGRAVDSVVRVFEPRKSRRRNSIGSMFSRSDSLSSWTSNPNRGCTEPCPRFGPHGGLFVYTRVESNR
jgi:hypothetical protein